jgi:iron complex outermembrane recepter protein
MRSCGLGKKITSREDKMKKMLLATTALSIGVATPQLAVAQDSNAQAANEQGLTEIVVTAQRKTENAQRAAIAIDVVMPGELGNAGIITPAALNAAAPALIVTRLGGPNTSFFVRGVGNFTGNAYSDPAIAFNLDGVYLGRPTSTTGAFYDLERVEILKGPQGTLYGRNATGGAVNVIPVKPRLGEFSGYASAGYGNYDMLDLEGAINAPLGGKTAVRLSGKLVRNDGYNIDGTDDEKSRALRFQLLTEPADGISIRIGADYSHSGGSGTGSSYDGSFRFTPGAPASSNAPANYTFIPSGLAPRTGLLSPGARAYFATLAIPGAFINPAPVNTPFQDNDYWGVYGEANFDTSAGTLTLIPAYRDAKINTLFNGPSFRGGLLQEHDKQFSLESRFQGNPLGPIDWLIGGFYYDENIKGDYTFSQYLIQSYQEFKTGTESYALFGRVTANLSEKVRLVGGLRYTHDKKMFNGSADTLIELCANAPPPFGPGCFGGPSVPVADSLAELPFRPIPTIPGVPVPFGTNGNLLVLSPFSANRSISNGRVTWRAAAEYDVGPATLLYASYETGYRSGGFSTAAGFETYQPEYIDAATLGVKSRFLDNRAQLNLELFHWKYRGQQVSHFGPDARGNANFFTQNIGRSTIQGLDIDGRFLVARNTQLRGSIQYLDSKLKSFSYNTLRGPTSLPPVTGCAVSAPSATPTIYIVDCAGKRGTNSPKWSINAGIEQTFDIGAYKAVFNGDMRYRSNRVTGFDYLPQQNSGADTTFDASLALGPQDEKWALTAYIRNIGDKQIPGITQFLDATGESVTTQYTQPRTYGVRGTVKF